MESILNFMLSLLRIIGFYYLIPGPGFKPPQKCLESFEHAIIHILSLSLFRINHANVDYRRKCTLIIKKFVFGVLCFFIEKIISHKDIK